MSTIEKITDDRLVIEVVTRLTAEGARDNGAAYSQFLTIIRPLLGGKKRTHELVASLVQQKVVKLIGQERQVSWSQRDKDRINEDVTIDVVTEFDFSETDNHFDSRGSRIQFVDNGRGIDERINKSVTIRRICVT
jgi:hypothetical protein